MCAESIRGFELFFRTNPVTQGIWERCGPADGDEFRSYVDGNFENAESRAGTRKALMEVNHTSRCSRQNLGRLSIDYAMVVSEFKIPLWGKILL
jgi:hypothetical protein